MEMVCRKLILIYLIKRLFNGLWNGKNLLKVMAKMDIGTI